MSAFSSPESAILSSVSTKNNDLWLVPNQEVRESRTSGSSTQSQKFESIAVTNGYKNAPSLRLRMFRDWPEVVVLGADRKNRENDMSAFKMCYI